ncbi:unnamed protein product, partial [Amoebophrya sp. A25]|eukprot:GSA25T00028065001.1
MFLAAILNMGNKFSVSSWCRVAELVMKIMATLGHTVVPIYIDDAIVLSLEEGADEAIEAYEALCDCMGLELATKATAQQDSRKSPIVRILGLHYDTSPKTGIDVVEPDNMLQQVAEVANELRQKVNTGQLDKKVVQRLLGLANFITVSAANRAGNEIMRSLYAW